MQDCTTLLSAICLMNLILRLGATMEEHATLLEHCLVMGGDSVEAHTTWQGKQHALCLPSPRLSVTLGVLQGGLAASWCNHLRYQPTNTLTTNQHTHHELQHVQYGCTAQHNLNLA